jgi:hypothetical protein
MSITEFASLELISPHSLEDPHPLLAKLFARLADQQAAWSSHDLLFFTNTSSPSEIYLITGWKDVPAHEKWIASDQNKELVVKFGRFLKVNGMVHLNLDYNTVPTDKQIIVCEKYGPWSEIERLGESKEEKEKEAELQGGSQKEVEWVGAGRNLDPKAGGDFYKFTACTERWRDKIVASATKNKEIAVLKRVDIKVLGKKP